MAAEYTSSGEVLKLMETYLALYTTGKHGSFDQDAFDPRKALLGGSISEFIRTFGQECIFGWTSMLMKKRVVVLGDDLAKVQSIVRTMPLFCWHRQDWSVLRPFIVASAAEL